MENIKSLEKRLESANLHLHSEKEAWEQSLQNLEESWRSNIYCLNEIMIIGFSLQSDKYVVAKKIIFGYVVSAVRCEALKSHFEESSRQDVEKEFEELKQGYKRLKASIIVFSLVLQLVLNNVILKCLLCCVICRKSIIHSEILLIE